MYKLKSKPLDKMKVTQPFGVNWVYPGFYAKAGLPNDKHNGIDFSCNKANLYAVDDGWVVADVNTADKGYGINIRLFIKVDGKLKYEVIYAHLDSIVKEGAVKAGDLIGISDNSGYSTGPHLHFGIRELVEVSGGHNVVNVNNGYFGYLDPEPFFVPEWLQTPVERKYGRVETFAEEVIGRAKFAPDYFWYLRAMKKVPSQKEYNALRYGFWDARFINDPAMQAIWEEMTKPEAVKRGIVK